MKIALASPPYPQSLNDGLYQIELLIKEAAGKGAEIICFPETYLPGYPETGIRTGHYTARQLQDALNQVGIMAAAHKIAVIMPMDWHAPEGLLNVAQVISNEGEVLGYQTKNQLDPSEDELWVPGTQRAVFNVNGLIFGIVICHEGFRYPELVRWAARQGAQVVFHPNLTGSSTTGVMPVEWAHKASPYYEKAQMMRALENTIYFATSNYALPYPESASAVIAPDGTCIAHQPYGQPGVLVVDIDLSRATCLLAKRFKPELHNH